MADTGEAPPAGKSARVSWPLLGGVALAALAAGIVAPSLLPFLNSKGGTVPEADGAKQPNHVFVPFGDVVVNLRTPNQTRYLRVKIVLVADKEDEQGLTTQIERNKAFLKNSVIGYLADRSLEDVKGTAGINRIRRELLDQFNILLYPEGPEKVRDLLFEEFFTQ